MSRIENPLWVLFPEQRSKCWGPGPSGPASPEEGTRLSPQHLPWEPDRGARCREVGAACGAGASAKGVPGGAPPSPPAGRPSAVRPAERPLWPSSGDTRARTALSGPLWGSGPQLPTSGLPRAEKPPDLPPGGASPADRPKLSAMRDATNEGHSWEGPGLWPLRASWRSCWDRGLASCGHWNKWPHADGFREQESILSGLCRPEMQNQGVAGPSGGSGEGPSRLLPASLGCGHIPPASASSAVACPSAALS